MDANKMKKTVLPIAGVTMAAGAALVMMSRSGKKQHKMQKTAGRAIKAVGEAVEHYQGFKL
jgi:archaellin